MNLTIRLPNINALNERDQLVQIRSYLYQLAPQLNWALANIDQIAEDAVKKQAASGQKSQAEEAQASFAEIKSLIIKSADIVNAYSDVITQRLDGVYVADADFAVYAEKTSQTLTLTSQKAESAYKSMEVITGEINEIRKSEAHIRTGLLFYVNSNGEECAEEILEGTPVYGVEVGQTVEKNGEVVFDKFGRFTSSGLVFYDENGTASAYISDRKLRIPHAKIEVSLTEGGYEDEIRGDGSVVTRWVGV